MKKSVSVTVLSLLLSASVVLNGVHAKDLAGLSTTDHVQKQDVQGAATKIGADLHPHVDKHFVKAFSDTPQADSRSLRLRESKRNQPSALRDLFATWRDQFALYLG